MLSRCVIESVFFAVNLEQHTWAKQRLPYTWSRSNGITMCPWIPYSSLQILSRISVFFRLTAAKEGSAIWRLRRPHYTSSVCAYELFSACRATERPISGAGNVNTANIHFFEVLRLDSSSSSNCIIIARTIAGIRILRQQWCNCAIAQEQFDGT